MAFCSNCGNQIGDDIKFCPSCGSAVGNDGGAQEAPKNDFASTINNFANTTDTTGDHDAQDITQNKFLAVLAYLNLLVLVPIFAAPKSKFARFHANQGLVLLIMEVIWWVASGIILGILSLIFSELLGLWFVYRIIRAVLRLINVFFVVLAVLGIVNAANGNAKELPLIGKIRILK